MHAALPMANLQAHLRSLCGLASGAGERMTPRDLINVLQQVNRVVWKPTDSQRRRHGGDAGRAGIRRTAIPRESFETRHLQLEQVVTKVFAAVQQFSAGNQSDDLTLVVARAKSEPVTQQTPVPQPGNVDR